jgi:hypothetical protein
VPERRAQVGRGGPQLGEPARLVRAADVAVGVLREGGVPPRMTVPSCEDLVRVGGQPVGGEGPDRVEQAEVVVVGRREQGLTDESQQEP